MYEQNNGKWFSKIFRNKYILSISVGLVEARVIGARAAEGDVIVILDAHCECVREYFSFDYERIFGY